MNIQPGGLAIEDLQRRARTGDVDALTELGRRVLDLDFCLFGTTHYCQHEHELHELQRKLDIEIPPECPSCGHFLTDH